MNNTALFWLLLVLLSATVMLYAAIAWRAFFFRPPVTLWLAAVIALAALAYERVEIIGLALAAAALPALVGWHIYYVYKDWQSRSLRLLVAGLLFCLLVTAGLYFFL